MIREAIKHQQRKTLFSCIDCAFYTDGNCTFEPSNVTFKSNRQASQMPDCFTIDPLQTSFAGVLGVLHSLDDVEAFKADRGWDAVVGKVIRRCDRFGYFSGASMRNLNKYG
jgi:hypothetical protein